MKNVKLIVILLLMSSFCFSQNGLTNVYPQRITLEGKVVNVLTDEQVKFLNLFNSYFNQCQEEKASLEKAVNKAEVLVAQQKFEIDAREQEMQAQKKIEDKDKELLKTANDNIADLTSQNKKLTRKTGFMGGVIVVLGTLSTVLALK